MIAKTSRNDSYAVGVLFCFSGVPIGNKTSIDNNKISTDKNNYFFSIFALFLSIDILCFLIIHSSSGCLSHHFAHCSIAVADDIDASLHGGESLTVRRIDGGDGGIGGLLDAFH